MLYPVWVSGHVSELLVRWGGGDEDAFNQLMPLVYDELRKLGRGHLRNRQPETLLQPTILVHEAWMKLSGRDELTFQNRAQFYALASRIMRGILVDHCRRQTSAKRGGSRPCISIDDPKFADGSHQRMDLIALDDALQSLARVNARYAEIVNLKFFGGLTTEEIAGVLKSSCATIEREWAVARAWLKREVGRQ